MEKYIIRNLEEKDRDEFLDLLEEFNGYKCDKEKFKTVLLSKNNFNRTLVLERENVIISSLSVCIDLKFYQNVGRVEDVITKKEYRGLGYASALIEEALSICKEEGCYKIVLNCSDKNMKFYEKNGFQKRGNEMCMGL